LSLLELLDQSARTAKIDYQKNGTYLCIEGPQFSTRAESKFYKSLGADVIGMTNVPEAFLAKEAGLHYATVAMVTDYDCWQEGDHCTLEEIMNTMKSNYVTVNKLISSILMSSKNYKTSEILDHKNTVVTKIGTLPDFIKKIQE
jgi:5'-methylthioadenosine phosphorylase